MKALKVLVLLWLVCWSGVSAAGSAPAARLTFYTEDIPPMNYVENGRVTGFAVDLLHLIWQHMGESEQPIAVKPWAEAYRLAQKNPMSVVFATARLQELEPLFKWVGPIKLSPRYVLMARKRPGFNSFNVDHIGRYRIGAIGSSAGYLILRRKFPQYEHVVQYPDFNHMMRDFESGELDMVVLADANFTGYLDVNKLPPSDYFCAQVLAGESLYFAFNNTVPSAIIKRYADALAQMKKNGSHRRLLSQYRLEE